MQITWWIFNSISHQKLKKTSVNVSAHVNSANTIQYIIHLTWNQENSRAIDYYKNSARKDNRRQMYSWFSIYSPENIKKRNDWWDSEKINIALEKASKSIQFIYFNIHILIKRKKNRDLKDKIKLDSVIVNFPS